MAHFIKSIVVLFFLGSTAYGQNSLLWRISKQGVAQASYLFGTVHVGKAEFINFYDSVYAAINSCKAVYGEINLKQSELSLSLEMLQPNNMKELTQIGETMDSIMKTPRFKNLLKKFAADNQITYNERRDDLNSLLDKIAEKTGDKGLESEPGLPVVDDAILSYGKESGLKLGELESINLQIKMLYSLIKTVFTDTTISIADIGTNNLERRLAVYYNAQNLDSIYSLIETLHPKVKWTMLDERNITMAVKMDSIATAAPSFFAVGAAHLPGTYGLIQLMQDKGYTVTPVYGRMRIAYEYMLHNTKLVKKANQQQLKNTQNLKQQ